MFENIYEIICTPNAILSFILCVLILILLTTRRKRKFPPGPKGIPFIGPIFPFKKNVEEAFLQMTRKYGPIFQFKSFGETIVVLGNYEIMKEAFIKQGDIFSGRPKNFVMDFMTENKGIPFAVGDFWKEQRRFALSTLRDFGFGKLSLEERIIYEVSCSINEIQKYQGSPFDIASFLGMAFGNIIMSLSMNKRLDYDDEYYKYLVEHQDDLISYLSVTNPVNFFPVLRHFTSGWKKFNKNLTVLRKFQDSIIKEHETTFDPHNKRDYIDVFLERLKEDEKNNIKDSTFTRKQLELTIETFFGGGTETGTVMIRWAILYLIKYPDIQKKVQQEIDSVLGSERSPSMLDRPLLPFTEATILEIMRCANIAPLSVGHSAERDTKLHGYDIVKGCCIIPNMTAIHFDPAYWPDPHKFDPTRFLNQDGTVKKNMDSFMPFFIGKRSCLGESLAKMELFIFFTSFLQHFTFQAPPGNQLPKLTDYIMGGTKKPLPYKCCALPR